MEDMLHARLKPKKGPSGNYLYVYQQILTISVFDAHVTGTILELLYRENNQKLICSGHYFHACLGKPKNETPSLAKF